VGAYLIAGLENCTWCIDRAVMPPPVMLILRSNGEGAKRQQL